MIRSPIGSLDDADADADADGFVLRAGFSGLPLIASVLGTVTLAFAVIGLFLLVVASQLGLLAQNLPTFQANIVTKLDALSDAERPAFLADYRARMARAYPPRADGRTLFPFRRIFIVASAR